MMIDDERKELLYKSDTRSVFKTIRLSGALNGYCRLLHIEELSLYCALDGLQFLAGTIVFSHWTGGNYRIYCMFFLLLLTIQKLPEMLPAGRTLCM